MRTQLDDLRAFVAARPGTQPARTHAHVIAVAGGKGGIGTSTVATLMAWSAARQGRDTLLADAAGRPGSLRQLLGIAQHDDTRDDKRIRLRTDLTLASFTLPPESGPGERAARYRRFAAGYAGHDLVIVDAGSTVESVLNAASHAGRLVVVTAADRVAVAAAFALLKVIGQRLTALPIGVLANGCTDAVGAAAFERINTGALRFLGCRVGFAGTFPEDPALRAAADAGRGLESALHGAAAVAADAFVARLLHEGHEARLTNTLL